MSAASGEPKGPDLKAGVRLSEVADGGMLAGHVDGEAVLLARQGDEVFAIGASCTHYGGPLAEGLFDGKCVRCPWHHARFDVRSGDAVGAPALNPVAAWQVERRREQIVVAKKIATPAPPPAVADPATVVIVGGGAAGHACAQRLRREGHAGRIIICTADSSGPVDRPNLSKDYLAGKAPEEWMPLGDAAFFAEQRIELRMSTRAVGIDVAAQRLLLDGQEPLPFDALVLATGADPVQLSIPGAKLPHVHYLRTLADSRAIIAEASAGKRAVVIGASFIGLEVSAALRARGVEVHVVASDEVPLARVLGPEVGAFVRKLHEAEGVVFHLGQRPSGISAAEVALQSGQRLPADFVVVGVGVRPSVQLAEQAGLAVEGGILVDEYLQTSAPGIWAAGDVARWLDPLTGERLRVEHWVVAERMGQHVARGLLGRREKFAEAPFFWSQHYDVGISYSGHAHRWDRISVAGSLDARDATVSYWLDGRVLAVATINRDLVNLQVERAFEAGDQAALQKLASG